MFFLLLIWARYAIKQIWDYFWWLFVSIFGIIQWIGRILITFLGEGWIVFIISTIAAFVILLVVGAYQTPIMQTFDAVYSCVIIPPLEFGFSLVWSSTRVAFNFLVVRWNDIILGGRDCFNALVNMFFTLPSLDNVGFYTDIARFVFDFFECIILLPFETPSWILPFGISGTLSAGVRANLCFYEALLLFITGITDFTIIRNDPTYCSYDPDADCVLRQLPGSFVPHFPPTNIGLSECGDGIEFDCRLIECGLYAFSNFTEVIQSTTGFDFSGLIQDLVEPSCCVVVSTYKPPLWLGTGLLSGCIDLADAVDFIIDNMLIPLRDCYIDIFFILSQGQIDNIFTLLFSVIFDFIAILIDSYNFLIQCIEVQSSCFADYPGNCQLGGFGFATDGLQDCFEDLGTCVIDGDPINGIPPNPILTGPFWESILEDSFPNIALFIDTVVCNLVPFQRCMFGPDFPFTSTLGSGSCPNPTANIATFVLAPQCFFNCLISEVPILRNLGLVFNSFLVALDSILEGFNTLFGFIYGAIEFVCDIVDNIPSQSCNLPPFPGMREERQEGKQFKTLYDALVYYELDKETTFCPSIMMMYASAEDSSIYEEDKMNAVSYRACLGLFSIGLSAKKDFGEEISLKRLFDFSTVSDEYWKIWRLRGRNEIISPDASRSNSSRQHFLTNNDHVYSFLRTKSPDTHILRSYSNQSHALALREQGLATSPGTTLIKDILSAAATRMYNIPGVELTKGFVGFVHRVNKLYYADAVKQGSSLMLPSGALNVTDLIAEDDPYYRHLVQTAASWSPPYPLDSVEPWQIETNRLEKKKFFQQLTLDYFSHCFNTFAGVYEDGGYRHTLKKKLREAGYKVHNDKVLALNKRIYDLDDSDVISLTNTDAKTVNKWKREKFVPRKAFTMAEIEVRKKDVKEAEYRLKRAWKSLVRAGAHFSETRLFNFVYGSEIFRSSRTVKTGHMLYSAPLYKVVSSEFVNNFTQYQYDEMGYDLDRGFITKEEEDEIVANRDNSSFQIWNIFEGTYQARRKRRVGVLFTDPDAKWFDFKGMKHMFYQNVKELKLKQLRRVKDLMGDFEEITSEELVKFRLESVTSRIDNWVVNFIDWAVNEVIGALSNLFFDIKYNINFGLLIFDWIESFDPDDIVPGATDALIDYFNDLVECNIPEDFDGTNPYKFGCFPNIDEGLMDRWAIPIGMGQPYFPLQSQIHPEELTITDCTNVFNGNPSVWEYRRSDNCPIADGQPRPLCPVCDYCQRDYRSCSDVGRDGITNSFFFPLGMIGPALQYFYRGSISIQATQTFFYFFVVFILGGGGFVTFFTPYLTIPAVVISSALTNFIGVTFSQFEGFSRDDLPVGVIYTTSLLAVQTFANSFLSGVPAWFITLIFYGLSATWFVNLVFPFNNVQQTLAVSAWAGEVFEFLNLAPQPFKPAPFSSAVEVSAIYDYSNRSVPYLDFYCFMWTLDNVILIGFGAFAVLYVMQFLFYVAWPTLLLLISFIQNTLVLMTDLRFWRVKERARDNSEELEKLSSDFKFFKKQFRTQTNYLTSIGMDTGARTNIEDYAVEDFSDEQIARFIGVELKQK